MSMYARIKSRKLRDGSRVFTVEYKEIEPGALSRWPYHTLWRYRSQADAVGACEARHWTVVKTWTEAMQRAGVHVEDGVYVADRVVA